MSRRGACEVAVAGEDIGGEEEQEADGGGTKDRSGRLREETMTR